MSIKREQTNEDIMRGATNSGGGFEDYMGVYPREEYYGSNSINYASRGQRRNDLYIGGGDSSIKLNPQSSSEYPHNQVQQTASGHVMEMDDTPGGQRILIMHNTGSGVELRNDGSVVATTGPGGNKVEVIHGDHHFIIEGDGNITYKGNLTMKVTGDYNLAVQGDYNVSVAGNKQTNVVGSNRYHVNGNYGNIVTGGYSTTVVGQTTNTHLGGLSTNVKGTSNHNVDGPAGFSASGEMKVSSEAKINMSTPDANIAATNLSVFGDTGTIGGENIVMYNYNMHTGHTVWADTVNVGDGKVTAKEFVGSLTGNADTATEAGKAGTAGAIGATGSAGTKQSSGAADDTTETALPNGTILSDYLSKSANGVNRVKIDRGDHIKNQIDKTVDTGGLSTREVTTGVARSRLRDPANRSNSTFVGYSLANGAICEKYDNPTPEGIGRIVSGRAGTAAGGSTKIGTGTGSAAYVPDKKTKIAIIPEPQYNPYQVNIVTSSTALAPGITMSKFLGSSEDPTTLNHLKTSEARRDLAKYYYLHARIMKTVLDDTDQFKDFTLVVTEGLYRPGPQETITAGSINYLKSTGRAVVYSLVDNTGNHNLTKMFDLAAYWKDTIAFDRMILSYDTIDCKLTVRLIVILPEIDDKWEGTYSRTVETEFNNHKLTQGELVEVLPFPSSSYSNSYSPSGSIGAGYSGSIKGNVSGLDNRLVELLETAAMQTGLNVTVTSGVRDVHNNPSGRHAGFAADIALYDGKTRLTVTNSYHLGLIQDFIKVFIDTARSKGLVPSVGAANHGVDRNGNQWPLYMNGNTFHVDVARTPGIGATLSANAGPYWGGSGSRSRHVPAPDWLVSLF